MTMDNIYFWIFIAYGVGTVLGYQFGIRKGIMSGIESAIDNLVKDGYLYWRKNRNGEIEVRKINEEFKD